MNRNPTILILGAGSDMAKWIARKFASSHFAVQLAGRDISQMERLKKDLVGRYRADVSIYHFDAIDFDSHASFISLLSKLPDIVLYTAGYMCDQQEAQEDESKTRNTIDVNFTGAVSILNQFAIHFGKRASGTIIGISSVAGDRGRGNNYIYGSSKAAFSAYLSGMRNGLFKKNVRVITVKPGFVYTKMTQHMALPKKLVATPEEVAEEIYTAVNKNKDTVYVKSVWRWIMWVIKLVPEPIFKRINL